MVTGESKSADKKGAGEFQKDFEKLIKENNLVPVHVYNADKTGLFYKIFLSKTLPV